MTISTYSPEQLDQLALRFLDLAAQMRGISRQARQHKFEQIPIHDRKAIQWCENLELWAKKTDLNFRIAVQESQAGEFLDLNDD